jgi:hypothetical protein
MKVTCVMLRYEVPSGGIDTIVIGYAVTMREIRNLMWDDAEKFHGKDVVLNKEGGKYAVYINGKLDTTEWYVTEETN